MAKGPKWGFKIPEPRFGGYTPTKFQDGKARSMLNERPSDANQGAPTVKEPVRRAYKMAGGC